MKKYEKPQIEICQVAGSTMLNLSFHNETGNGVQRSKQFDVFDEEDEDEL